MATVPELVAVRGEAFTFYTPLTSQVDTDLFQVNPTLAENDVKVSIDGGVLNNPATLPDVEPDGSKQVRVQLTADEMNGGYITVIFCDVAGAQWQDLFIAIKTEEAQAADVAETGADGDTLETLSDQLDAAQTDLDSPNQYKADVSLLAIEGNVQGYAADALVAYDPPTRAEATVDKDAILVAVDLVAATVWAAGARTLTSFGTLADDVATAVWTAVTRTLTAFPAVAASIWSYATRTLTQSGTQVAAVVSGDDISLKSYTTWIINLTGIGDISNRTKLYFTAKRDLEDDPDTASDLQLVESKPAAVGDGLLYINRTAAVDASKGSIVVTDEVTGNLTITVDASVTGIGKRSVRWGVKKVTLTTVQAVVEGDFEVDAPTAQATS